MTSEGGSRGEEITSSEDLAGPAGEDAFVLQQRYLYECIANDVCMDEHYNDVLTSMIIVAAADESAEKNEIIKLGNR
jgi:hypothetical protein